MLKDPRPKGQPHDPEGNALQVEIALIKQQLKRLDSVLMEKKKPWYYEVSTLVAVLALIFSFGTTFVSYVKSSQQEVISSRLVLKDLIKDITLVPQEYIEIVTKYKDKPQVLSSISAQINSRNLSLSNRAAAVIDSIDNSAYGKGSVSHVELMTVGTALFASSQINKSKLLFEKAYARATDAMSAAESLRSLASVCMAYGDITAMRKYLEKASSVFSNVTVTYPKEADINKHVTNVTTELQWALAEFQLKECKSAVTHLEKALPLIKLIPGIPVKEQLDSQATEIGMNLSQVCKDN